MAAESCHFLRETKGRVKGKVAAPLHRKPRQKGVSTKAVNNPMCTIRLPLAQLQETNSGRAAYQSNYTCTAPHRGREAVQGRPSSASTAVCPPLRASSLASTPDLCLTDASALASSKSFTTSWWPIMAAACSAVHPSRMARWRSGPLSGKRGEAKRSADVMVNPSAP